MSNFKAKICVIIVEVLIFAIYAIMLTDLLINKNDVRLSTFQFYFSLLSYGISLLLLILSHLLLFLWNYRLRNHSWVYLKVIPGIVSFISSIIIKKVVFIPVFLVIPLVFLIFISMFTIGQLLGEENEQNIVTPNTFNSTTSMDNTPKTETDYNPPGIKFEEINQFKVDYVN